MKYIKRNDVENLRLFTVEKNIRIFFSTVKRVLPLCLGGIFIFCLLYACASPGTPSGGAYDIAPPRYITSVPTPGATNFKGKKVEIIFDELITLEKPSEKIIITPPQKQMPIIKSVGKKVIVEFQDSLQPNATYTIDFTNSIVDNNEKNPLENYSFAFSTGASVDSLVISGVLLNAENLEPMPNILIGLHTDLEDSAFTHTPFVRTTKTNDKGQFWVRNVSHGTYRIFALNDMNRDYLFDQPGENIAFYDSTIVPSFEPAIRQDTIWKDSLTVDTIMDISYNRFTPDDITMFFFKEKFGRQYLTKPERTSPHKFTLYFNTIPDPAPEIEILDVNAEPDWFIPEYSDGGKTISYWITDSVVYNMDTLKIEVNYLKSDSLNMLVPNTDTLSLFMRKRAPVKEKKKKKGEEKIDFLAINISAQTTMEVTDTLKLTFSEPVLNFDASLIKVNQKVDTLWQPREFVFLQDSLDPLTYYVDQQWSYGAEYQINIDSAAFLSIYGKWTDSLSTTFKLRQKQEYGNLYVIISGIEGAGIGELLNSSDVVVGKSILHDGEIAFPDIKPGKYYLRYIEDTNNNGKWDTGNYATHQQPEKVFYYPGFFDIRQDWDVEQNWNVTDVSVQKQKPLEITKNKPEQKKKRRDENTNTNNTNTNRSNANNTQMPTNRAY